MARHVKAMKKRDKFLLALSCIFLIGILCLIAGISMGGTLFAFRLNQNINPKYTQNGTFTLSEKDSGLITGIDFDFHCQDITIQRGDTCSIQPDDDTDSLESKYYSYIKDRIPPMQRSLFWITQYGFRFCQKTGIPMFPIRSLCLWRNILTVPIFRLPQVTVKLMML